VRHLRKWGRRDVRKHSCSKKGLRGMQSTVAEGWSGQNVRVEPPVRGPEDTLQVNENQQKKKEEYENIGWGSDQQAQNAHYSTGKKSAKEAGKGLVHAEGIAGNRIEKN